MLLEYYESLHDLLNTNDMDEKTANICGEFVMAKHKKDDMWIVAHFHQKDSLYALDMVKAYSDAKKPSEIMIKIIKRGMR